MDTVESTSTSGKKRPRDDSTGIGNDDDNNDEKNDASLSFNVGNDKDDDEKNEELSLSSGDDTNELLARYGPSAARTTAKGTAAFAPKLCKTGGVRTKNSTDSKQRGPAASSKYPFVLKPKPSWVPSGVYIMRKRKSLFQHQNHTTRNIKESEFHPLTKYCDVANSTAVLGDHDDDNNDHQNTNSAAENKQNNNILLTKDDEDWDPIEEYRYFDDNEIESYVGLVSSSPSSQRDDGGYDDDDVPPPPPGPATLGWIAQAAYDKIKDTTSNDNNSSLLDLSALVAMGILLEDTLTERLMSLARAHVNHWRNNTFDEMRKEEKCREKDVGGDKMAWERPEMMPRGYNLRYRREDEDSTDDSGRVVTTKEKEGMISDDASATMMTNKTSNDLESNAFDSILSPPVDAILKFVKNDK